MTRAHPDPFLRSMALWTLKEHQAALSTLLVGNAGTQHAAHDDETRETKEADPNVFNFYVYLRTHPLLVRQHIANVGQRKAFLPGGNQVKSIFPRLVLEMVVIKLEVIKYFLLFRL